MAFQDRLTVVIDFVTGPAQSGLKKLRTDVAQAEGAMGKAKAAAVGLGGSLQQYAGQAALAAGTAIVAFGVKSVKAFTDGALAAGKFADATGIAIEDASRWISVAGDIGIEAGTVQGAFQRMNKAIADGKPALDEFADAIVRADDGTVNASETFRQLITRIDGIKDPTERARVAQEVFGRSYGEMARLMTMSAGELKTALESTQDAEVFTEAERRKAEKYEAAMDALGDSITRLSNNLGSELVPAVTDSVNSIAKLVNVAQDLKGALEGVTGIDIVDYLSGADTAIDGLGRALDGSNNKWDRMLGATQAVTSAIPFIGDEISNLIPKINVVDEDLGALPVLIEAGTEAAAEMARIYGERVPPQVEKSRVAVFQLRDATADAEAKAQDLENQWATLFGTLDNQEALLNLQDQFDQLYAAGVEAYAAGVEGSEDAEAAQRKHQQAIIDTKREVGTYAKEVLGLPVERVTKILADIDDGKLDEIERQLQILSRNRTISLDIIAKGGVGYELGFGGRRARGGPVQPGKAYLVGEEGPEVIVPGQSGMVIPNGGTRAISSGAATGAPMVVNISTGADPEDVVRAIERYKRRNGSLPFI
jgi:hypothetical protein